MSPECESIVHRCLNGSNRLIDYGVWLLQMLLKLSYICNDARYKLQSMKSTYDILLISSFSPITWLSCLINERFASRSMAVHIHFRYSTHYIVYQMFRAMSLFIYPLAKVFLTAVHRRSAPGVIHPKWLYSLSFENVDFWSCSGIQGTRTVQNTES